MTDTRRKVATAPIEFRPRVIPIQTSVDPVGRVRRASAEAPELPFGDDGIPRPLFVGNSAWPKTLTHKPKEHQAIYDQKQRATAEIAAKLAQQQLVAEAEADAEDYDDAASDKTIPFPDYFEYEFTEDTETQEVIKNAVQRLELSANEFSSQQSGEDLGKPADSTIDVEKANEGNIDKNTESQRDEDPTFKQADGDGDVGLDLDKANIPHAMGGRRLKVDKLDLPHAKGKLPEHHHRATENMYKTFLVGPERRKFVLPLTLLVRGSGYFEWLYDAAPYIDNIIYDTVRPGSFAIFCEVITRGTAPIPEDVISMIYWADVYVIAAHLRFESVQNTAIDRIRDYYWTTNRTCSARNIDFVLTNCPEDDKLRLFMIHSCVTQELRQKIGRTKTLEYVLWKHDALGEYLAAVSDAALETQGYDPSGGPYCAWHTHNETPECVNTPISPMRRLF